MLGRASINLITLQTIVVEIEAILNDRPLTYVSPDFEDQEPLTPSHLLYGRRITSLPHPCTDPDEVTDPNYGDDGELRKHAARVALLIQHFWQRWKQEYLTSLRELHGATGTNSDTRVKVGDVVQIHSDSSRLKWNLAVVESLIRGADKCVRAVNLRTCNGRTNRPITKLYPLEITAKVTTDTPSENLTRDQDLPQELPPKRSQRAAAIRARGHIVEWAQEL